MLKNSKERQTMIHLFRCVIICYLITYLWANLFNRHAFNLDMYADAQVATMMWEQKTLFPKGWVFGNQYYVIATPVLSALLYGLTGDSILALGLASCVMGLILLFSFCWMLKPFVQRESLAAGAAAFSGVVILGVSICHCTSGMQLLYTMASYYSCYLIVFLLVMGIYLRLNGDLPVSRSAVAFVLMLCFLIGIQSLRETLVLAMPLFMFQLLACIFKRTRTRCRKLSCSFAAAVLVANLLGVFCARWVPAKSNPMISTFSPPSSLPILSGNMQDAFSQFVSITGINYRFYGLKYLPLFALSVGICAACLAACLLVVRKGIAALGDGRQRTEEGPFPAVEICIAVSVFSLLGVIAVRVFLGFEIRTVYFFIWFLLASLSFVLLLTYTDGTRMHCAICTFLLLCGVVNLFYNIYPDAVQYREQKALMERTSQKLIDAGVDCLYVEYVPFFASAIAACSGDQIEASPVRLARDKNGYYYEAYPATVKESLFTPEREEHAVLVLSESVLSESSSFRELEALPGAMDDIMGKLDLLSVESNRYASVSLYQILDPTVVRCH